MLTASIPDQTYANFYPIDEILLFMAAPSSKVWFLPKMKLCSQKAGRQLRSLLWPSQSRGVSTSFYWISLLHLQFQLLWVANTYQPGLLTYQGWATSAQQVGEDSLWWSEPSDLCLFQKLCHVCLLWTITHCWGPQYKKEEKPWTS